MHSGKPQSHNESHGEQQIDLPLVMTKIQRGYGFFLCFQVFFPYLREKKEDNEEIEKNNRPGNESEHEVGTPAKQSAQNRTDGESESKHRTREPEILGPVACRGDVRNIRLTDGHAGAPQSR